MSDAEDDLYGMQDVSPPSRWRGGDPPEATRAASDLRGGTLGPAAAARPAERTGGRWRALLGGAHHGRLVEEAREDVQRAAARLAFCEMLPEADPCVDGEVLRFRAADTGLWYVALRVDGRYWLTGGSHKVPQGVSWEALAEWLSRVVGPGSVDKMRVVQAIHEG
jgi:hypothetical protein